MSTRELFGGFITDYLDTLVSVPEGFARMLNESCVRLMDSRMIIEDPMTERRGLREPMVQQELETFDEAAAIDALVARVRDEGLAPHFHSIVGLFGSILVNLTGTEEQRASVDRWVADNTFGAFLMTDAGGAQLDRWHTALRETDDGYALSVDKIWGIEAHRPGFAMVVARQPGRPYPATVMLPPRVTAGLEAAPVGLAYLDGRLQLGNVRGEVSVERSMFMSQGGAGAVNRFLTLVRPRFVKTLMQFVLWLADHDEVTLDDDDRAYVEYLLGVCDRQLALTTFSMHSVDRVRATKFASNELLLSLVTRGRVRSRERERDLLAFTKMEGSSYRCLVEIYGQARR